MMERFSKKTLTDYLQRRVTGIQREFGFSPDTGTFQIEAIASRVNRSVEDTSVAYGQLMSLLSVAEEFDLAVHMVPTGFVSAGFMFGKHAFRHVTEQKADQ